MSVSMSMSMHNGEKGWINMSAQYTTRKSNPHGKLLLWTCSCTPSSVLYFIFGMRYMFCISGDRPNNGFDLSILSRIYQGPKVRCTIAEIFQSDYQFSCMSPLMCSVLLWLDMGQLMTNRLLSVLCLLPVVGKLEIAVTGSHLPAARLPWKVDFTNDFVVGLLHSI